MKFIYLIATLFFTGACTAQQKGSIQLFGYKQAVLPGTIPADVVAEEGQKAPAFKPKYRFHLYAASNRAIKPVQLWLQGQLYDVQFETVNSPVRYENPTLLPRGAQRTLVPKTSRQVISLTPAPATAQKAYARAKALAANHELVIVYEQSGRTYYQAVKQLMEIEPLAAQ